MHANVTGCLSNRDANAQALHVELLTQKALKGPVEVSSGRTRPRTPGMVREKCAACANFNDDRIDWDSARPDNQYNYNVLQREIQHKHPLRHKVQLRFPMQD